MWSRLVRPVGRAFTPRQGEYLAFKLSNCASLSTSSCIHEAQQKPKSRTRSRTTIALQDLPDGLLDAHGNKLSPLGPVKTSVKRVKAASKTKNAATGTEQGSDAVDNDASWMLSPEDETKFLAAVEEGTVPNTNLARVVWSNWQRFPNCILLTQVGNFYESYFEPAAHLASLLGIICTRKSMGGEGRKFPFAGFPLSQRDKYVRMLVEMGNTVVIIEEDNPAGLKARPGELVPRKVARVVTPGTLLDDTWVNGGESRYLLAIAIGGAPLPHGGGQVDKESAGQLPLHLAYADVSTGEFFCKAVAAEQIEDELARIAPREVVLDSRLRDLWHSTTEYGAEDAATGDILTLLRVLGVHVSFTSITQVREPPSSPKAIEADLERSAIALLQQHLQYALRDSMPSVSEEQFNHESTTTHMLIDAPTLQALEIRHTLRPGGLVSTGMPMLMGPAANPFSSKGSLLSVLNRSVTDSGHRLLVRTLSAPSTSVEFINSRQALVSAFVDREPLRTDVRQHLRKLGDVMRVIQRLRTNMGGGHDVYGVASWIRGVQALVERVNLCIKEEKQGRGRRKRVTSPQPQPEGPDRLAELVSLFQPLADLADKIEKSLDEDAIPQLQSQREALEEDAELDAPSSKMSKTEQEARDREEAERKIWWIRPSFSDELDKLHKVIKDLHEQRDKLEIKLRHDYNAPSLSLGTYKGNHAVIIKKKTEIGMAQRSGKFHPLGESRYSKTFAYHGWTELGGKIEDALEKLGPAQNRALNKLRAMVVEESPTIQQNAELVDEIDLTAGFAQAAVDLNYVRPVVHEGVELKIVNGRHPSVEAGLLSSARMFTPNSTEMTRGSHLHIITGPNQGGKSTLLRQTAIIAILAQSGSFVPADHAEVGVVDRVFSRIGARDDLFRDRSTFMLEMVETAAILKHATPRSLVIMDEIGRGTTLQAGVSIAYATLEYILNNIGCRTLFATHYHELATMLGATPDGGRWQGSLPGAASPSSTIREGVRFFCTDVDEMDGTFAYSYHLKPGVNYKSHAIKAAQLAGMPESFISTAEKTLMKLQATSPDHT